ncbi:MAG: SGNH/GDSL hydrolase family protein [Saprospiraceae bacterium]
MIITYCKSLFSLCFVLFFATACSTKQDLFVDYSNAQIAYAGRIDSSQVTGAELYWSGTSVKINFVGTSLSALLEDETGENYYNVIIDNDSLFILHLDLTKRFYPLATNLAKGEHTVEIFKRTEWDRGKTIFYGFQIAGNAKLLPKSKPTARKIEFYGDSITAGYAIEDTSGKDSPDSTFTNHYLTYAALTARHFNAEHQCICRSGIGITVSWVPLIMPELYDRLNPTDSTSQWDFSQYTPDVVVVNLFQNDSWLVEMPDSEEFQRRFNEKPDEDDLIQAYQDFISDLRNHYPNAHIICSLGGMDAAKADSKWMDYIEQAAANLDDQKIYTHFMPYIPATAHPSVADQEVMATDLIGFMEETIGW